MFYLKKLNSFRDQEFRFQDRFQTVGTHYVFLEDTDDIVNIHGTPYQQHFSNLQQITSIRLGGSLWIPDIMIMLLIQLQKSLNYNQTIEHPHSNTKRDVFFGITDIMLMPTTSLTSVTTLLPTFQVSNRIWVKDMTYTESDTFFLESFAANLWLAFIGIFMLFLVISLLLTKVVDCYKKSEVDTFDIVSLILDQGVESTSSIWSHKILLFSLGVLLIIFFIAFEAFLSSLLAVRKIALPFHDLNTLFTQNEYSLCLTGQDEGAVSALVEYEKSRDVNFILKVNAKDCPEKMYQINYVDLRLRLDDLNCKFGKSVFITSGRSPGFRKFCKHCNVTPLPGKYISRNSAIICHPGFKYRKIVNRMLVQFRTAGVLQNDFLRSEISLNIRAPLTNEIGSDIESITFHQVHLILIVLMVGYALSLIILLIE